ncbi:GntP family permease [Sporosarcina thermotolerans]|uniref:GntP family permease n=1 Tax=Sporosarcina thermotolerans TaxID=633404 RepID=A0AAW9A9D1_9BACL|nr:GntP family permease [Sporosarcina thermotolerans]MDW0117233.1 GntP family permease [Sporosarcina thermotolerans]WHT47405.1 GntP family permease [Sporosarcina thermotolerans]
MGTIGILIAIALIVILAMKGFSIVFIAPLAAIVVIVTNGMDFFPSLIGNESSFMTGLSGFLISFFGVFLLGAILAQYIEKSGAAQAIAQKVLSITGTKKPFSVLVAILIISAILTFGGISLFVVLFVVIPLAKPLFKELNIAWNLVVIPIFIGIGTFTMTMLPGTPSIQNVVPTNYLGTTLTAAPLMGIVASLVAIIVGIMYMRYAMKKSIAAGNTFAPYEDAKEESLALKENIPSFLVSILPILVLIIIIFAGSAMKVDNIVLIGLGAGILAAAILFHPFIPSHKTALSLGANGSITPIFFTAAAVAFGVVITMAPGFKLISDFILGIPGNPLISLTIASASLGAMTGSSSGGLGIAMEAFAQSYLDMGVNPDAMHRISAIASSVLTGLPHAGAVLSLFALAGLNHKNSFKYAFISMTLPIFFALIVALIMGITLY